MRFPDSIFGPSLRLWLLASGLWLLPQLQLRAAQFDLSTATIADINAAIDAGSLSSEKLVQLYLARIAAYDKQGPKINVVVTPNPKVLDEARALDAERKSKGRRSPLHGIPVVIKDLIDLEGFPTTAGFKYFGAPVALRDAAVVTKLKESGAIIIAKVTTMNWFGRDGYGPTSQMGAPLNPYNLEYLPGDSSSGTGASVAAYFATVGIGTDTGGSVVNPTAYCSLAGMVATQGLISRSGIVPRGPTHDRAGPMARNVYDMTVLLTAISGWDAEDLGTYEGIGHFPQPGWVAQLASAKLAGKRIGILREMIDPTDAELSEGRARFDEAVAALRKAGAQVIDVSTGVDLRTLSGANASQYERIPFGNIHLLRYGPNRPFKTLEEMIEKVGKDKVGDFYTTMLGQPLPDKNPDFEARIRTKNMLRKLVDETAEKLDLDAFVFLFNGIQPHISTANRQLSTVLASRTRGGNLTSMTGLPAVIVPGGYTTNNLPVGIQFMSRSFDDLKLIQIAYAFEQATQFRRAPATTPALPGETFTY